MVRSRRNICTAVARRGTVAAGCHDGRMATLTVRTVTYLGGHPDHKDTIPQLTAVFDRSGIVIRRRLRRLLSVAWTDLRGLDIQAPDIMTFILAPSRTQLDQDGTTLLLETDQRRLRFHVDGMDAAALRESLASWAVEEAGPTSPLPATPAPAPRQVADELDMVRVSLEVMRAAQLGHAPLYDRDTLAYRLAVAENHRVLGQLAEALALLKQLALQAERTFGADDDGTLKVRNTLAQTHLAGGEFDDGLEILREVVGRAEHRHGADGRLTLVLRNNLAAGYQQAGQYAQAIDLHEQNLRYTERRHGHDDIATIGRRNNLAGTFALAGRRREAIDGYWAVLDALPDAGHRLGVTARQNLAILHNPTWRP